MRDMELPFTQHVFKKVKFAREVILWYNFVTWTMKKNRNRWEIQDGHQTKPRNDTQFWCILFIILQANTLKDI
jgi:hypothetical protein